MQNQQSMSDFAAFILQKYIQNVDYLSQVTRQQLQRIRMAAVHQVSAKDSKFTIYKGLIINVDDQIAYRDQSKVFSKLFEAAVKKQSSGMLNQKNQNYKQQGVNSKWQHIFNKMLLNMFSQFSRSQPRANNHSRSIIQQEQQHLLSSEFQNTQSTVIDVNDMPVIIKKKCQKSKEKLS